MIQFLILKVDLWLQSSQHPSLFSLFPSSSSVCSFWKLPSFILVELLIEHNHACIHLSRMLSENDGFKINSALNYSFPALPEKHRETMFYFLYKAVLPSVHILSSLIYFQRILNFTVNTNNNPEIRMQKEPNNLYHAIV